MVKYTASECRDDTRWRRRGTIVEYKNDNNRWVPVLQVKPSQYGRGLFALQSYAAGDYVCAYFGRLVHKDKHPQRTSDMVMQSGLKDYVIQGRPSTSISGGVFVNSVRFKDKRRQNTKISVRYVKLDSKEAGVMAKGNVVPVYRCIKPIQMMDEILADYNWSDDDWARNLGKRPKQ